MIGFKTNKPKRKSRRRKRKQSQRRRYVRYAIFAGACYIIFIIATLPASVVVSYAKQNLQLQRQLQISAVTGTVWSGSAESVQTNGLNLGTVQWDLKILPLLFGKVKAYINFNNKESGTKKISGSGLVAVSYSGELSLNDFSAALSADALAPLMYGLPARFAGNLNIRVDSLTLIKGKRINLKSRILVANAALVSPQKIDYGNILIQSTAKDTGSQFVLTDQGGPLILNGTISLTGNGTYRLNLGMGARETASADLEKGLRFLGQRDATGRYRYKMNGKLGNW